MAAWYFHCLKYPRAMLLACLVVYGALIAGVRDFTFDASADTLVVEGDPALARYNRMSALFGGGDDFVVLTYTADNVVSETALREIAALQDKITALPKVKSAYSILDVPLIESPPVPLDRLSEDYKTLRDPDVDPALALRELTSSPLISDFLISRDGGTTLISAALIGDELLERLYLRREQARRDGDPGAAEAARAYQEQRQIYIAGRSRLIAALREIRDGYEGDARLFISGVPMIAADMLSYAKSDLVNFSGLVLLVIVLLLAFFFRKIRWVVIPLVVCLVSVGITMGILGLLKTPITFVSSNFVSLLSIMSISFSIHLIVRYREVLQAGATDHEAMVFDTMKNKFAPCLYTALTTLLAFGSMTSSGILPIVDFGWMMCIGIGIAFMVTYTLFPTILLILGPSPPSATLGGHIPLTAWFEYLSTRKTLWVIAVSALLIGPTLYGASLVSFDNRFTDYFSARTDIHRGMTHIDAYLGGTLPLDIYIRFEAFEAEEDDFFDDTEETYPERYWFTPNKITTLEKMHAALEAREEIGKVISLASLEEMARRFKEDGSALTGPEIAYVLGQLPAEIRRTLIDPYARPEAGWLRVNARIRESQAEFSKQELITAIEDFAAQSLGLGPDDVVVTGMIVLFNDMLQQLAGSQASTFAYVVGATFLMFALLLRSLKLALVAILPNAFAALLIIAIMGYAGIAMDVMTVTIAAICIGVGVHDAIHYLHRYRHEIDKGAPVDSAVVTSHRTIGRAMYYTTITVMGGFSVLMASNFIPTVYFGILTALAMGLALLANMTLMPSLVMVTGRLGAGR